MCVVRFVCENVGWEDGGMVPSSHGTTYRQQLLTCIVSSNYLTIRPVEDWSLVSVTMKGECVTSVGPWYVQLRAATILDVDHLSIVGTV